MIAIGTVCEDDCDLNIRLMHPKGTRRKYPKISCEPVRDDVCYIPQNHILCKISAPIPVISKL